MTLEFGNCSSCGASNSKSVQMCRSCGAALPWNKAASKTKSSSISVGDVAWAAIGVQLLGGVVFLAGLFFWFGNVLGFFPTFPGLGYITGAIGAAIWGAGSRMD